jgi:hypothetical protein
MSTIERRLRASVGMDAINGDSFERSVCGKQMIEAATEIERLKTALSSRDEPVASVTGYHSGHCVIEPIDRAVLLPVGMALYSGERAASATTQDGGHCDYPDCRCPIDKTDSCLKGLPNA